MYIKWMYCIVFSERGIKLICNGAEKLQIINEVTVKTWKVGYEF